MSSISRLIAAGAACPASLTVSPYAPESPAGFPDCPRFQMFAASAGGSGRFRFGAGPGDATVMKRAYHILFRRITPLGDTQPDMQAGGQARALRSARSPGRRVPMRTPRAIAQAQKPRPIAQRRLPPGHRRVLFQGSELPADGNGFQPSTATRSAIIDATKKSEPRGDPSDGGVEAIALG
jgi:hypothetical protein